MKRGLNNKILAVFVCMCIMLTILSATGFALFHGDHECTGVHCTVCEHLKDLANVSRDLGDGIAVFLATFLIAIIFLKKFSTFFGDFLFVVSLISLKVRMNN